MPIAIDEDERREIGRLVKIELRDRMRRVRRTLGYDARAARSAKIAARVVELPEWASARTVALFVPMRTEIDVELLARVARAEGKCVAAPRMVDGEGATVSLELHAWEEGVAPVESGRMVREPPSSAPLVPPEDIDLVIVPGLAFDDRGARLGYGAGLYDRLLPRCVRARAIGVAFDFQLLAEIPEGPGDVRVHAVVTDERVVRVT